MVEDNEDLHTEQTFRTFNEYNTYSGALALVWDDSETNSISQIRPKPFAYFLLLCLDSGSHANFEKYSKFLKKLKVISSNHNPVELL